MMFILLFVLALITAVFFMVLIYLLIISTGRIQPFTDESGRLIPNSIAEKVMVKVNGAVQGMFIRGKDRKNPILLFIHGGPGVPEYFLNEACQTGLENHFTVCWWESRGSGLSYSQGYPAGDITTNKLIEDTISVTEYLKNRFGKDKIYLMGHSFGTLVGLRAAAKRPDLYYAYIGMAQAVGNELGGTKSNTLTYEYMSLVFKSRSDGASLKKLDRYSDKNNDGTVTFKQNCLGQLDNLKHKAGCGTMHNMDSVITGIFLPQMNSKCYTLSEKINYWRGKAFMRFTPVYKEFVETNLFEESLHFTIPIYFFSGIYDYTCPYPLTLEYFKTLDAPLKGFYTFNSSAHSPLWEEPDQAIKILLADVVPGTDSLSD